ncbi:hypothetical protein LCGC14_0232090 [marine sediment metagenome]|uniref:PseI/NeuA/B-like domain-containing protein n=1 Tax=marine sediment metagenome TaxID=412755 RepID=A0A0F9WUQ9_9ZZZZ
MFRIPANRCFMVAEIGINHNSDLDIAFKLIKKAKEAGFDCVKFQKRTVDVVYGKEELDKPRESPWGTTNREQKMALELSRDDYDEINSYCAFHDILWTASPWDEESVDFLMQYDPPYIKIASACLTDAGLLRRAAETEKPLFLSTGMTTLDMIYHAMEVITNAGGEVGLIYHCTSTYPCAPEDINLLGIKTLMEAFPRIPIGYSGHEPGLPPSVMAAALGARSIERHITLQRSMYGSDQAASLDPEGFRRLVRDVRLWEAVRGDGILRICESEKAVEKKLRRKNNLGN